MEFENEFDVKAPLEQVWNTVLDVERVAPCVPGAEVLEQTGDDAYKVGIKVRVGPVSMQYRGELEIVEKDESAHSAVMSARARETRGQGTANANVRMTLSACGGTTHGVMATEVQLSGRAAAMGQGVIKDVSAKIIDQFAENLAQMLGGGAEAVDHRPSTVDGDEAPAEPAAAGQGQAAPATPTPSQPASPPPAANEGLDVVPIAKSIAAERLRDPRVMGFGIALLFLLLLRRRRR